MDLKQAIERAIDYETRVRDVYRDAADATEDPAGKRVLEVLAQEEEGHLTFLESRLREWADTGTVGAAGPDTLLPSPEAVAASVKKLKGEVSRKDRTREIGLLEGALKAETETSEFYERMVRDLGAEGKRLFGPFVQIERGHRTIVQAELDSLRGVGFWFDLREFDLEAG